MSLHMRKHLQNAYQAIGTASNSIHFRKGFQAIVSGASSTDFRSLQIAATIASDTEFSRCLFNSSYQQPLTMFEIIS